MAADESDVGVSALELAQIDDELAALGGHNDLGVVDRRSELYDQRDRMTNKVRETESVSQSARLTIAEAKITDFVTRYDSALNAVFTRIELLEHELEQLRSVAAADDD